MLSESIKIVAKEEFSKLYAFVKTCDSYDDCSSVSGSSDISDSLEELSFDEVFESSSSNYGTDSEGYDSEDQEVCNRSSDVTFSSYQEKYDEISLSQDEFEITVWKFSVLNSCS
jgi:hypothetical protein